MGAMERFQKQAQNISDAYSSLQDSIFQLIIDTIKNADYKHVDQGDVVTWQAEQLQKAGRLNREAIRLMSQADGISQQAIEDLIKFHGMQIADEADQEVNRVAPDRQAPSVNFSITPLLDGIADQTWKNLQNNVNESLVTTNYGESAVTHVYRRILTESTTATVSGLLNHQDAVESAIYRAVDHGLPTRLIDRGGHNWSMEGYVNMVVNTTTHRTYNEVRLKRMKDFGMSLCLMSSHPNSRPACAYIQGHVVNIVPPEDPDFDPRYDSIYNHGYGEPSGTQGINCHHRLFQYVPGVSENHQPQYDPEEAIKNGKLVQQQRARERAIRDAKHRLAAAKELGDTQMENQAKTLLRARQLKMRQFIDTTNQGHKTPILTRDYDREKIVHPIHHDFMSKKQEFRFVGQHGNSIHVHTSQVRGAKANIWTEGHSKKYRDTIQRVDHLLANYKRQSLPKIVITDSNKLRTSAAASYDHVNDALFINSDVFKNKQSTANYLKGGYFASKNADDIIKHEMTHKMNWDKAKTIYVAHPDKFKSIDDAINQLNEPIMSYVDRAINSDPYVYKQLSDYAKRAYALANSRELVAELNVSHIKDDVLKRFLKGVL